MHKLFDQNSGTPSWGPIHMQEYQRLQIVEDVRERSKTQTHMVL